MGRTGTVKPRLRVHPSVVLWLSVLCYLKLSIVGPFLLSALLHELGHTLALCHLHKPPHSVTVAFSGAVMESPPLSYQEELLAAFSGPAVSLLLGLSLPLWPELGFYSLILGLFNLLPIRGLDGGRILRCLLFLSMPESRARRICRSIGIVFSLLLFCIGITLTLRFHAGIWPMACTAVLLYKALTTDSL